MSFVTFVARRHLKIKNQRKLVRLITLLAALGVGVGVMVLMVVIAVMTGFQAELRNRILGIEAHVTIMRYNDWIGDYPFHLERLQALPEVAGAAPFIVSQGMVRSMDSVAGLVLRGIDPARSDVVVGLGDGGEIRSLLATGEGEGGPPAIVLGAVLAEKLGVVAGDELLLMVAGTQRADARVLPRTQRMKVTALFETGMHQYDGAMGFVNIHRLQSAIGVGDVVTGLEVRLHDPDNAEIATERILAQLGGAFWANHWKQLHRNLFSMLGLQKIMMYVILTLIILVGAFNVVSALIMMVKEKTKDIAILKAMGADNGAIARIFLYKGMTIGAVGIGLGLCAGVVLCLILDRYPFISLPGDVYFLTTLPVRISFVDLAVIALGTFAICVAASLYPARRASAMKPVSGVRYG
ncbi:ABC transporter permease [Desulfatitalea alkaliphila]|uniref:ABC transporter permease n=1 Tax=Desulfatitalea alkaliphila TaxID=2929485 RepID=A0AA41R495_9BACT|nr:ABC transporter permease [Desulfatitalea alkaliphila]MCJ8500516.1 ABC transporter permease [Desulfatitalea alkaliphila]